MQAADEAVVEYTETIAGLLDRALLAVDEMRTANASWEDKSASYAATHVQFEESINAVGEVLNAVQQRTPPDDLGSLHGELVDALSDASESLTEMLAGLESTDDGTHRRAAASSLDTDMAIVTSALTSLFQQTGLPPLSALPTSTTSTTTTTTRPPTTTTTTVTPTTEQQCHPSYVGECVPINVSDVDCRGGSGDGPYYVGRVTVVGPDVYGLDRDNDGIGCESS